MNKYQEAAKHKKIAEAVIRDKSTEDLIEIQKFITNFLDMQKVGKLHTTYVNGTKKAIAFNEQDRVYFDFRFEGTVTGRLSCAGQKIKGDPMGLSFHTLPNPDEDDEGGVDVSKNIRSIFTAPDGWVFLASDYSTMELRVLSVLSGEYAMKKAFLEGRDLHTATASMLFGTSEENVSKKERKIAKTINFLIVYGGGPPNLAQVAGIPLSEAEQAIDRYKKVFPRIFHYMEVVEEQLRRDHYVTTIFGRRRHLPNITSFDKKKQAEAIRQAVNFTVQSAASDVLVCACEGIMKEFEEKGMEARVVATVHDSIEVVCPKHETEEALKIKRRNMMNPPAFEELGIEFDVPLVVDCEVGYDFGVVHEVEFCEDNNIENKEELAEFFKWR